MAKKVSELDKLQGQLSDLVDQRDQLEARIVGLEAERDGLDVVDAAWAVSRLQEIGGELDAAGRVLPALDEKIAGVRAFVAQEQDVENQAKIAKLRDQEAVLWKEAQKLFFGPFRDKLDSLQDVHRDLGLLGAGAVTVGSPILYQALDQMRDLRCQQTGDYSDHS